MKNDTNTKRPINKENSLFHNLKIISLKELTDAFRNRIFISALIMLVGLTLIAISIGAITVHKHVSEYKQSVEILKSLGRTNIPPMPDLNPIAVSKNFINYLGMVGALLAIILGFTSINKERKAGTLRLLLSRPVYRDQLLTAKILGNVTLLAILLAAVEIITYLALIIIGGISLTASEIIKLTLTMGMSLLYMLIFFLVSMFFSIIVKKGNHALLLTIIVWLVFAFILPQIGDTMDLDNQIPGGFFVSMGFDKNGEKAALAHFKWYETVRGGLENLSPTKHYERISFALLGIKTQFIQNTWMEVLRLKIVNIMGLLIPILILMSASYIVFLKEET